MAETKASQLTLCFFDMRSDNIFRNKRDPWQLALVDFETIWGMPPGFDMAALIASMDHWAFEKDWPTLFWKTWSTEVEKQGGIQLAEDYSKALFMRHAAMSCVYTYVLWFNTWSELEEQDDRDARMMSYSTTRLLIGLRDLGFIDILQGSMMQKGLMQHWY